MIAIPRPIPLLDPVTRAAFPERSIECLGVYCEIPARSKHTRDAHPRCGGTGLDRDGELAIGLELGSETEARAAPACVPDVARALGCPLEAIPRTGSCEINRRMAAWGLSRYGDPRSVSPLRADSFSSRPGSKIGSGTFCAVDRGSQSDYRGGIDLGPQPCKEPVRYRDDSLKAGGLGGER